MSFWPLVAGRKDTNHRLFELYNPSPYVYATLLAYENDRRYSFALKVF